jgi:hypothetical protein
MNEDMRSLCVFLKFFEEVSVHKFYGTIYMHMNVQYISNKFEIRTKKNSRRIYNIYSISDDHIQFRTRFHT